ncbi:unnamed protein product [Arabis nemorensis]|uniref:Uncharacterized protein n=1 Tax=Arabis nemorensis TaxID=586526 RepID=A0A565CTC9_9BRAS|nr:unnamed protein product [Arabis nemorensis]
MFYPKSARLCYMSKYIKDMGRRMLDCLPEVTVSKCACIIFFVDETPNFMLSRLFLGSNQSLKHKINNPYVYDVSDTILERIASQGVTSYG